MDDREIRSCCNEGSCCPEGKENKQVSIDFLYLDLSVCQRCQGTEQNLEAAIGEVAGVLASAGYEVKVNRINISSRALAVQYEFLSSPTIRVNGQDIVWEVTESVCKDCGDLCGDNVACRSWVYENAEYAEPPKAMLIAAILKAVFGGETGGLKRKPSYVLPDNLKIFFDGLESLKTK